jgi:hypothetical protein
MAVSHSLLAVYGAFDQVVMQNPDSEVRARIEQFLPGTTGPDQRGWYAEIQDFVRRHATDPAAAEFPTLDDAMDELTGSGGGFDASSQLMGPRERARLTYASAAMRNLVDSQMMPREGIPSLETFNTDRLNEALSQAGDGSLKSTSSAPMLRDDRTNRLMAMLPAFTGRDEWNAMMAQAADEGLVTMDIAAIPAISVLGESTGPVIRMDDALGEQQGKYQGKCTGEVIDCKGVLCALLTTEFERSAISIDKVKAIVDPLNWDNCNKFFVDMQKLKPAAGRSQVLEYVSTNKDLYVIKTALKYWKQERGDSAVVNYDLSDNRNGTGDTGQVRVDSGYIILEPVNDGQGTRVLTSKMVAIDGLSPTAVAIYASVLGWVAIGEMMMFDCALKGGAVKDGDDPLVPWQNSPEADAVSQTSKSPTTTTGSGAGGPGVPPVAGILMAEASNRMADFVESTSKDAAVIADKWVKGDLTVKEVVDYTGKVGARLASEPWRLLDDMINRLPARPSASRPAADEPEEDGSP